MMDKQPLTKLIEQVNWNSDGLVPAVAQDSGSGRVLTLAWMNRESLALTVQDGRVHYWSRSRNRIWRKGEESGYEQRVAGIRLDCDRDAILLTVTQSGGIACHTGRESCFYLRLADGEWQEADPVIRPPGEIYGR